MGSDLSFSVLLAQLFVAFSIEIDNSTEISMQHRTTLNRTGKGPWLVSTAMYFNCLRHVDGEGVLLGEMEKAARTSTNLNGMIRWGYITLDQSGGRTRASWIVRPTPSGLIAKEIWPRVIRDVEERWKERFGKEQIQELKESLLGIVRQFHVELPDCMPVVGYGLVTPPPLTGPAGLENLDELPLIALVAKVLLAFTLGFEKRSPVSLAICANILRLVHPSGARVRDLPRASGCGKETLAVGVSYLQRHGFASVRPEVPGSRVKLLVLEEKGQEALERYEHLVLGIEQGWRERFGTEAVDRLVACLGELNPLLVECLESSPGNWRALSPPPDQLPYQPMVTHRGGYPDGG